jgi:hypothetical protein
MSREKLRIANTETDNLLGNLRGEIAEIVTCWILMRRFMASGTNLRSGDISKDLGNPDLAFVYLLNDKLEDDSCRTIIGIGGGKNRPTEFLLCGAEAR